MDSIGGKKDKNNDKNNRRKDKGKEKEIPEEEMPRNKKFLEDEKRKGKQIHVSDDGDDLPTSWDWRNYLGVISNVLDQESALICWAISFIRAMEALFNIGRRLEQQRSFSIQHLINNIPMGNYGLEDCRSIGEFVKKEGLLDEAECSYERLVGTCAHDDTPETETETIDRFVTIDHVDDVDLARLVMRHPVVGVLPSWSDFDNYREGIYSPKSRFYDEPQRHAVLIVGFGVDKLGYYWIIQNSTGRGWGEGGFGRISRESRRGGRSLFMQVYYGEKDGYPQTKNKKK